MMNELEPLESRSPGGSSRPAYISHYGIRARQYKDMIQWYQTVFSAKIQHENEFLAFMTFDEEHHRLVIFEDAATVAKPENAAGVDHVGYGLASFADLVATYERLKAEGITPFLPINHMFTTSLYYHDPDGNDVELSVDNFPTKTECDAFVRGEEMAEIGRPPFGYAFDPDELARLYHEGASADDLARIGVPAGD
ncbi:MAG TPA: VOC family protein [Pyrinomonadaceae bacterium]|nr:VOC family protein [Pyrinomonadaceae bacterium]